MLSCSQVHSMETKSKIDQSEKQLEKEGEQGERVETGGKKGKERMSCGRGWADHRAEGEEDRKGQG